MEKQVYLPVCVTVDMDTKKLVNAYVDFDGAPWMFTDSEDNVFDEDTGEWERDSDVETAGILALDDVVTFYERSQVERPLIVVVVEGGVVQVVGGIPDADVVVIEYDDDLVREMTDPGDEGYDPAISLVPQGLYPDGTDRPGEPAFVWTVPSGKLDAHVEAFVRQFVADNRS
jgi:hypothetical protein